MENLKLLINKIETKILKINELGLDTQIINSEFKKIISDDLFEMRVINEKEKIEKLKDIEEKLKKYDIYFRIVNTCLLLDSEISNINSKSEIISFSNKIIDILKNIKKYSVINSDEKILNRIYNTTYNIMKKEISITNKSSVYNFICNSKLDRFYLNNYVVSDIKKIDLNDSKYYKLKEKLFEINSNGIDNDYFDLDIIKLILYYENKLNLDNKKNILFSSLLHKINVNNIEIKSNLNSFFEKKDDINNLTVELNKIKKYLIKESVSLGLMISFILGGGMGVQKLSEKICSQKFYKTFTLTYSDSYGIIELNKEGLISKKWVDYLEKDILTYLNIYDNWKFNNETKKYERNITTYDISDYEYPFIDYCFNYEIDSSGYLSYRDSDYSINYTTTMVQTLEDGVIPKSEDLSYSELERVNIDKSEVIVEKEKVPFFMSCLTIFAIMFCNKKYLDNRDEDLKNIIPDLKEYLKGKQIRKDKLLELNYIIKDILIKIDNNKELKDQFNMLYEENKILLNNPNELYRKFDELVNKIDTEEVKKLIRKA